MHRRIIVHGVLLAAASCASASAAGASSDNSPPDDSARRERAASVMQSAAVTFRGSTLFLVEQPIGDLSIEARAQAIERRVQQLASAPDSLLGDLRVVENHGESELLAGEMLVRVVTEADARGSGRTRRQLAADQLEALRSALVAEFRDRGAAQLLRSAGYALAATFALLALLVGIRRAYVAGRRSLEYAVLHWNRRSGLARLRLLSPESIAAATRGAAATLAWIIVIALVFAWLQYALGLFPWTRGIAQRMFEHSRTEIVGAASAVLGWLPSLLNIVVIVLLSRLVLKALKALFHQVELGNIAFRGFYPEWAQPTYSLMRFLVIAVAFVMIFPYVPGSGSEAFKGVSVFLGLLVSLGAASAIANVIAGTVITYMRPFRIGDRVRIADAVGDVTGKDLFVVRLRTIKNVDITIPNSLALANHIVNFTSSAAERGLVLHTEVTIGYDAPWHRVHELLLQAAAGVSGVLADPAPFVLQTRLDDFYVHYELNAYTAEPARMAQIYSDLHSAIQDAFAKAGIEIMSPHYAAVRDGQRSAIPDEYLPKDYRAPAFPFVARPTGGAT